MFRVSVALWSTCPATLPQLEEIRETIKNTGRGAGNDKKIQQLDEAIAKIKAAKTKPTLVKLTEFKPQPPRSKLINHENRKFSFYSLAVY